MTLYPRLMPKPTPPRRVLTTPPRGLTESMDTPPSIDVGCSESGAQS